MSHGSARAESNHSVKQPFKEVYLSLFVLFYRISRWKGRMKSGTASICVMVVEGVFALTVWTWIEMALHRHMQFGSWSIVAAAFLIGVPTDYFLVVRGHGIAFEKQFRSFSKGKRIALYLAAIGIVLATGIAFYLTVANYHQVFHLAWKRFGVLESPQMS